MQVVYQGPFPGGVRLALPTGDLIAPYGEPVEVPDDVAAGLLEQDIWTASQPGGPKPKPPAPADADTEPAAAGKEE